MNLYFFLTVTNWYPWQILSKKTQFWEDSVFINNHIISNILIYKYHCPMHYINIICSIDRQNRNYSNFTIQGQNRNLCFCVTIRSLEGRWLNSDVSWSLQIRNPSLIESLCRKHLSPLLDSSKSEQKCSEQENTDHHGGLRYIHLAQRNNAETLSRLIWSEKRRQNSVLRCAEHS